MTAKVREMDNGQMDLSYFPRVFFIWKAFDPKVRSVFWSNKLDTEIFIDNDRSISLNRDNAFA